MLNDIRIWDSKHFCMEIAQIFKLIFPFRLGCATGKEGECRKRIPYCDCDALLGGKRERRRTRLLSTTAKTTTKCFLFFFFGTWKANVLFAMRCTEKRDNRIGCFFWNCWLYSNCFAHVHSHTYKWHTWLFSLSIGSIKEMNREAFGIFPLSRKLFSMQRLYFNLIRNKTRTRPCNQTACNTQIEAK